MSVETLFESKSNCVVPQQQLNMKNSHRRNTRAEQSVSSNYILDKFLEDDKDKGKMRKFNGSVGILQRSLSLKSLRGREEDSSFLSAGGASGQNRLNELHHRRHQLSHRKLDDDDEDNFSVLSLDRRTKRGLQRKSHYASEVHLPAHVLLFEAKSLFADMKSFRARSGTSNFALNPIYDEVVFAPPSTSPSSSPTERDQVPPAFNSSNSDTVTVNCENGVIVAAMAERDNTNKKKNNGGVNFPTVGDGDSVSTSSSSWNYLDNFTEQTGKSNCVETSFESLVSLKRKSKFQLKDFSDDLY